MCGIAGLKILARKEAFLSKAGEGILKKMIWPLRHRGPDGFGFFRE